MTEEEMKLDMLVAELDYENRLLRARNERLEREAEQRSQQQEPLIGGDDRRHIICLCPDCTKPAQPKPWVGIDAEDWNKIGYTTEFRTGADWAEAKLREKNQ